MITARRAAMSITAGILLVPVTACGKERTFVVPSPSMEPSFSRGDRVTLSKTPDKLETGMVVVFKDPGGWLSSGTASRGSLLKRVIGTGGDRVVCTDNDELEVNGKVLDEPYVAKGSHHCAGVGASPFDIRVPEGHLWLMGDNRDDSYDSRGHMGDPDAGYVPEDLVIGIVEE